MTDKYVLIEHDDRRFLRWKRPNGGQSNLELPNRWGFMVGYWIKPSPFDNTLKWEWVITNMNVTIVTGMSSGYTRTHIGAVIAARRALRFWNRLGYGCTPPPAFIERDVDA